MSDGVNSPIVRYKNTLTQSANHNSNLSDDDQVVMDKEDIIGEDEEPGTMPTVSSKSKADQFYEKFAEKMKKSAEFSPSQLRQSQEDDKPHPPHHSRPLGDSDDDGDGDGDGLYTEYEDSFKGMDFLERKAVAVPTLKLGELGGKK